jgi:hypothetical protein
MRVIPGSLKMKVLMLLEGRIEDLRINTLR